MDQLPTIERNFGDTPAPEISSHERALGLYIDKILALRSPEHPEVNPTIAETYKNLSSREKVDILYGKLMAYHDTVEDIRIQKRDNPEVKPEPVDPYLLEEIDILWQSDEVKRVAANTHRTARVETRLFLLSELGKNWHSVNTAIDQKRKKFEEYTQKLFLHELTRPDQISAAQGRTEGLAKELIALKSQREGIISLKELPKVSENTDIAAQIMYEQFGRYHEQLVEIGFVWLPSRDDIHSKTIEGLQNGRWPRLIGEAGTGKSEQADAAAVVLTGEQPTLLPCGPNTSERELIGRPEVDEKGSYELYGAAMQAATGYFDSRQENPTFHIGRIVRLDESGRMGLKGYSVIKELRQKRAAKPKDIARWRNGEQIDVSKLLNGKPVLPGFAAILATNPVGSRYPDRTDPDPAMRREFADIKVDYPPMSSSNPELYEFMIAALMDRNKHIPVAEKELAPYYKRENFPEDKQETLPDGRKKLGKDVLIEDPENHEHGVLYRLSFAIRSLQDAFIYGNSQSLPLNMLRYEIKSDGTVEVKKTGGEPLTLTSSTVTLGEVASWMTGFHERKLKDDPDFQARTLTEWVKLKLETYLNQVDQDDKAKIRALFEYYHLFDSAPDLTNETPITPKRIGYLSPRVPRPLYVSEPVQQGQSSEKKGVQQEVMRPPEAYQDIRVMLEDGSNVLINPVPIALNIREQR